MRLSDPILFGIIISLAIRIFNRDRSINRFIFKEGKFFTFFLLYVLIEVLRNLSSYGSLAVGEFRTYYQGFIILPYVAVSIKSSPDRGKMFKLLVILSLFQIILALFKGSVIQGFSLSADEKWLSAFGSLALLYGLFAFFLLLKSKVIQPPKVLIPFLFFSGIIILIIASNRSVWLAGFVGLIYLILSGKAKIKEQILIGIVILIVVFFAMRLFSSEGFNFFSFMTDRFTAFTNSESD